MTPDNVFVLCTGRCGSLTFSRAARHIRNFTTGHETRSFLTGPARFAFPKRHIEVDNRLAWTLGRLQNAFGDNAHYVHLIRDRDAVAASFLARRKYGMIKAYREAHLLNINLRAPATPDLDVAMDMIDTITQNIHHYLADKTHVLTMRLETIDHDFATFWDCIGASGNPDAALAEWRTRHNATVGS